MLEQRVQEGNWGLWNRRAVIKRTSDNRWGDCGGEKQPWTPLRAMAIKEPMWRFLRKLKYKGHMSSSSVTVQMTNVNEITSPKNNLHSYVPCNTIYRNWEMGTIKVSINRQMNEGNQEHTHTLKYYSAIKTCEILLFMPWCNWSFITQPK